MALKYTLVGRGRQATPLQVHAERLDGGFVQTRPTGNFLPSEEFIESFAVNTSRVRRKDRIQNERRDARERVRDRTK
jgi:hypothetical protein